MTLWKMRNKNLVIRLRNMNYEFAYVVYLDILGFKRYVYDSVNDTNKISKICDIQKYLLELKKDNRLSKKFTYFLSDSVFIVYPFKENDISTVFWEVAEIQAHLICEGFLIRGGINIGPCYYDENFLFGPVVNDCVEMESSLEKPCVCIDERLIEKYAINSEETSRNFLNLKDEIEDAYLYLKEDKGIRFISHLNDQQLLTNIKDVEISLKSLIEKYINSSDERIRSKYEWFLKQYSKLKNK